MLSFRSQLLRALLAAPFAPGLAACSPDAQEASCAVEVGATVVTATSAGSGKVGTPVPVTYVVSIGDGCGKFQQLREQREGNKVYLVPIVRYEGCTCPQVVSEYQGTYQFTATQPGQYVLLFPNPTRAVADTITIQ